MSSSGNLSSGIGMVSGNVMAASNIGPLLGQTPGPYAAIAATPTKIELTHFEVRRVQNGFLVMGVSHSMQSLHGDYGIPQRISYVANTIEEVGTILASIVAAKDLNWVPTSDLPVHDLVRRPSVHEDLAGKICSDISAIKHAVGLP